MNSLLEYLKGRTCRGFKPFPHYSPDGDHVSYFLEDERCHAQRIDEHVTIYRADSDNRIVGFKLKGVRRIIDQQ